MNDDTFFTGAGIVGCAAVAAVVTTGTWWMLVPFVVGGLVVANLAGRRG